MAVEPGDAYRCAASRDPIPGAPIPDRGYRALSAPLHPPLSRLLPNLAISAKLQVMIAFACIAILALATNDCKRYLRI